MKCIAVDDEPLALNLVRGYIEKIPYLELAGTCESAYDTFDFLKRKDIDLIFLDINMPDLTGIQFIKTLVQRPAIILTTAYEKYALEGYELNVVDYLLKPFSFERFLRAVNKVQHVKAEVPKVEEEASSFAADPQEDYMLVRVEHNILKVDLEDIFYIEGFKDYVKIYTKAEKPLLTIKSMKALEEMLISKGFLRIHRSYIVALQKIDSMRNGRVRIRNKTIPVGENYKERFYLKFIEGKI